MKRKLPNITNKIWSCSAIVCLMMAFVLVLGTFAMADATFVTNTDVTGTDVTGTDVLACGDVNGDKKINAKDALMILKAVVGKVELTDAQCEAADAYQNGKIDAKDALYVLRFAVEKEASLPVVPGNTVTGTDVTGTDVTATNA